MEEAGAEEAGVEEAGARGAGLVEGLVRDVLDRMETLGDEDRDQEEPSVRVLTEIRSPVGALAEVRVKVASEVRPDPRPLPPVECYAAALTMQQASDHLHRRPLSHPLSSHPGHYFPLPHP